jgi:hypothetical protein
VHDSNLLYIQGVYKQMLYLRHVHTVYMTKQGSDLNKMLEWCRRLLQGLCERDAKSACLQHRVFHMNAYFLRPNTICIPHIKENALFCYKAQTIAKELLNLVSPTFVHVW